MAQERTKSSIFNIRIHMGLYPLFAACGLPVIWGNLSVYIISYFHFRGNEDTVSSSPWIISLNTMAWSFGFLVCERITRHLGVKITMAVASLLFTGSMLLCYILVQQSFLALAASLGVMCGFTFGVGQACQIIIITLRNKSQSLGFLCCSILSAQHIGAVLINLLITWYINPKNLIPDQKLEKLALFSQPKVLDRVPKVFIVYGLLSFVLFVISFLLMQETLPWKIFRSNDKKQDNSLNSLEECEVQNDIELIRYGSIQVEALESVTEKTENNRTQKDSVESSSNNLSNPETKHGSIENRNEKQPPEPITNCDDSTVTPMQALKTKTFYAMVTIVACTDASFIVLDTYYKVFGMLYYPDDHFFTNTSVAMNLGTFFAINFTGFASDRFDVKNTTVANICFLGALSSFFYLSVHVSLWIYFVCVIFYGALCLSLYYIMSVCSIRYFGNAHGTTIYGMAMSVSYVTNTVMPFLIHYILSSFGWLTLFMSLSVFTLLCLFVVLISFPAVSSRSKRK